MQRNFTGYYYDKNRNKVVTNTDSINGHQEWYDYSNGCGGSEGCLLWGYTQWHNVINTEKFTYSYYNEKNNPKQDPIYGTWTINRSFFGDGINGRNNWNKDRQGNKLW